MKLYSHLKTSVAYDGGREAKYNGTKHTVVIEPGDNELTDADEGVLHLDDNFKRHADRGFFRTMRDEIPELVAEVPAQEKLPGEKASKKKADEKPLDQTVIDFLALSPEQQVAMEGTLTPAQLAEVNKARIANK